MNLSFKFGDPRYDFLRKRNVNTSRHEEHFLADDDSDVTICFGSLSFPGHSFVFQDRCPGMFEYYAMDAFWTSNDIHIDDEDCSEGAVLTVLRFVYRGDIVFLAEDLKDVLHMSRKYDMDDLFSRLTSGHNFEELWKEYAWSFLSFVVEESAAGEDDEHDGDVGLEDDRDYCSVYDEYGFDDEDNDEDDECEDEWSDNGDEDEDDNGEGSDDDNNSDSECEEEYAYDDDDDGEDEWFDEEDENGDEESDHFQEQVWGMIEENAEALIALNGFTDLSAETIQKLLENDDVRAYETSLFNACLRWASAQCTERNWKNVAANWRKLMDPFINRIRFPLMSLDDFRSGPKASGVVHLYEVRAIERAIEAGDLHSTNFDSNLRKQPVIMAAAVAWRPPMPDCSAAVRMVPGTTVPQSQGRTDTPAARHPDIRNACTVCLDKEIGIFFQPCGHVAACVTCSPSLRQCPVCRKGISKKWRAFLP